MRHFFLLASLALAANLAMADGFMVPFRKSVELFEPNQNAIIAWNGSEEILILSTSVRASRPTKVLQFFAARSKPEVKLADASVFMRATQVLNAHYPKDDGGGPRTAGLAAGAPPSNKPAGRVEEHRTLGRHDVSITEVVDPEGFAPWAEEYLRSQGAENLTIPSTLEATIGDYIKKGFHWFVYDIVELSTEVQTNAPLLYRFKSDCLFYPLVYTQTNDRNPLIQLLVISKDALWDYPELSRKNIRVGREGTFLARGDIQQEMVTISASELGSILVDLVDLMGNRSQVLLREWKLIPESKGRFSHDLVAR